MQTETFLYSPNLNFFANNLTILQLTQIRDNLLISLISELTFNGALLSDSNFFIQNSSLFQPFQCKIEEKKQETTQFNFIARKRKIKKNRKLNNKSLNRNCEQGSGIKNDTKNIPKNYGKAILSYILRSPKTRKLISNLDINLSDFLMQVRKMKNKINSIDGLRKMWGSEDLENNIKKCIRILSYQFMRKHCLRYIFHSKVRNFCTHIKYRQKLIEGIQDPQNFSHIKDY